MAKTVAEKIPLEAYLPYAIARWPWCPPNKNFVARRPIVVQDSVSTAICRQIASINFPNTANSPNLKLLANFGAKYGARHTDLGAWHPILADFSAFWAANRVPGTQLGRKGANAVINFSL
ncbi:hypothetical protein Bpfe_031518 [Biomphalaria pfeifferi]|uniref:Uncharacterized protein n=1 Tax=Biomphalaria pfeifferi TaxID=112525 RepID=A0AAD8ET65_BIOPF|nr:hypothetical protein Bpfe_031518 [Biomphalaria pfeifferi]